MSGPAAAESWRDWLPLLCCPLTRTPLRLDEEAGELVDSYGTPPAPVILPHRAAYRHASAEGRTVTELEP